MDTKNYRVQKEISRLVKKIVDDKPLTLRKNQTESADEITFESRYIASYYKRRT